MTNQHSFIQFLFKFGACNRGIKVVKRFRTPQLFWDARSTAESYRKWLLAACKVRGFFTGNGITPFGLYNDILVEGKRVNKLYPKVPWKRGQRGQFPYTFQKRIAREYARKLRAGKDPLAD